jgi:hypothetical protein
MVLMKKLSILLISLLMLTACSDDTQYSNEYPVQCMFDPLQYAELNHVIGNIGQFMTIRKSSSKITMTSAVSSTPYDLNATQKYFEFGLGGLIVGTTYDQELVAYDLACPNCKRANYRLVLSDDGYATCPNSKCGIKYNLNYPKMSPEVPEGCIHEKPRVLFQYRVIFDGTYVRIWN